MDYSDEDVSIGDGIATSVPNLDSRPAGQPIMRFAIVEHAGKKEKVKGVSIQQLRDRFPGLRYFDVDAKEYLDFSRSTSAEDWESTCPRFRQPCSTAEGLRIQQEDSKR